MNHVPWEIKNNWEDHQELKINIPWEIASPNPQSPQKIIFKAKVNDRQWLIRRNDLPGHPQLTLLIEDGSPHALTPQNEMTYYNEIMHFDTWPEFWGKQPNSPDLPPQLPLSTISKEKDAEDQEIERLFKNTRIVHFVCTACIPLMVLIAFLTCRHASSQSFGESMWLTLSFSVTIIIAYAIYSKMSFGKHEPDLYLDALKIYKHHWVQSVGFIIPLFFVFLMCIADYNWISILPTSIVCAAALTWTFPSRKNWQRWRFDH